MRRPAPREVGQDFLRRGLRMDVGVGRVLELLRNPGAGVCACSSSARAMAPFMPFFRGRQVKLAPWASIRRRRSMLMLSGITRTSL